MGRFLPESGADPEFLADGTYLIPDSRWDRAQIAAMDVLRTIQPRALCRRGAGFWLKFADKAELEKKKHLVPEWHAKGNAALGVMESHLATQDWFAGNRYSIADIALYGYTHSAADGGIRSVRVTPPVSRWLTRVTEQPRNTSPLDETW